MILIMKKGHLFNSIFRLRKVYVPKSYSLFFLSHLWLRTCVCPPVSPLVPNAFVMLLLSGATYSCMSGLVCDEAAPWATISINLLIHRLQVNFFFSTKSDVCSILTNLSIFNRPIKDAWNCPTMCTGLLHLENAQPLF